MAQKLAPLLAVPPPRLQHIPGPPQRVLQWRRHCSTPQVSPLRPKLLAHRRALSPAIATLRPHPVKAISPGQSNCSCA